MIDLSDTRRTGAGDYDGKRYRGSLVAEFRADSWKVEQSPPLSLSVLREKGSFLALPGDASGGLRGGDVHRVEVTVSDGARLTWQAPASALYHGDAFRGEYCQSGLNLTAGPDAGLYFRNRPGIPCGGARIRQRSSIQLARSSELFFLDSWTSGRQGSGETWEFSELDLEAKLFFEGKLIYLERWTLEPGKFSSFLSSPAAMDGAQLWVSGFAKGAAMVALLREERDRLLSLGAAAELGDLGEGIFLLKARLAEAWEAAAFGSRPQNAFSGA